MARLVSWGNCLLGGSGARPPLLPAGMQDPRSRALGWWHEEAPTPPDAEGNRRHLYRVERDLKRSTFSLFAAVVALGSISALASCGGVDTGSQPSPSDGGGPVPSGREGTISVQQLVARSADTPVTVQGLLHVSGGIARLCAAVLESYPVQCGQPSVELVGLDPAAVEGVTTAGGVTWKERAVLVLERVGAGRFAVVDVEARAAVKVVLGLYSGVADSTWTLTDEEARELVAALAGLTRVSGTAAAGGLGYHGFSIIGPDGTLVAFEGTVTSVDSDPPYYLDDPGRTIERFLLETARTHVKPQEFAEVGRALDRP